MPIIALGPSPQVFWRDAAAKERRLREIQCNQCNFFSVGGIRVCGTVVITGQYIVLRTIGPDNYTVGTVSSSVSSNQELA